MWWDERRPGGRLKSLVFLLHPGPSLLVTATFVAAACLTAGQVLGWGRVVQLVFLMLPIQFAIGVVNDLADVGPDAGAKPYKPLVTGAVSRQAAVVLAVCLGLGGLAAALTSSPGVLALAAGGLAAGMAYDLGLRRTPLSLLPWWGAFVLLPLTAFVAGGRALGGWVYALVPLAGLLALSLHLANGLPDIDADRRAGRRSLPVVFGPSLSRRLSMVSLAAAAVVVVDISGLLGQRAWLVVAGASVALAVVLVVTVTAPSWPFRVLAPAVAMLAITWLAALPS